MSRGWSLQRALSRVCLLSGIIASNQLLEEMAEVTSPHRGLNLDLYLSLAIDFHLESGKWKRLFGLSRQITDSDSVGAL